MIIPKIIILEQEQMLQIVVIEAKIIRTLELTLLLPKAITITVIQEIIHPLIIVITQVQVDPQVIIVAEVVVAEEVVEEDIVAAVAAEDHLVVVEEDNRFIN